MEMCNKQYAFIFIYRSNFLSAKDTIHDLKPQVIYPFFGLFCFPPSICMCADMCACVSVCSNAYVCGECKRFVEVDMDVSLRPIEPWRRSIRASAGKTSH